MPLMPLLSKENAPLRRLSLSRIQLDVSTPTVTLEVEHGEALLYTLVGRISMTANGRSLGTMGGRHSITEPLVQCVRFPANEHYLLTLRLESYAADLLWVKAAHVGTRGVLVHGRTPVPHWNDCAMHEVGEGTHRREVRVVPQVAGYELYAGETLSYGTWSSWPAHATDADRTRYAEWEEVFWCVTAGEALIAFDGIYCTGQRTKELRRVHNGEAFVTPLGAHPIVAFPQTMLYYAWFYLGGHVLEKTYNRWATDMGTYVK